MPFRAINQVTVSVGESVENGCPPPVIPIDGDIRAVLTADVVYVLANVAFGPVPEAGPLAKAVLFAGTPVVPGVLLTISPWLCAGILVVASVTDSAPDTWPKS